MPETAQAPQQITRSREIAIPFLEFVANVGGGRDYLSAGEVSLSWSGALDCQEIHSRVATTEPDLLSQYEAVA